MPEFEKQIKYYNLSVTINTFCAFIDFKNAYDTVNREILWVKLEKLGFSGLLVNAIKSLYSNVMSSVKLNGFTTDWFSVHCGLKQGCSLSPPPPPPPTF